MLFNNIVKGAAASPYLVLETYTPSFTEMWSPLFLSQYRNHSSEPNSLLLNIRHYGTLVHSITNIHLHSKTKSLLCPLPLTYISLILAKISSVRDWIMLPKSSVSLLRSARGKRNLKSPHEKPKRDGILVIYFLLLIGISLSTLHTLKLLPHPSIWSQVRFFVSPSNLFRFGIIFLHFHTRSYRWPSRISHSQFQTERRH